MLRYFILGVLRDDKQRHAYALFKEYGRLTGDTTYAANVSRDLKWLEKRVYVAREDIAPGEDERCIPFKITAKGAALFQDWLVSAQAIDRHFSTWLIFLHDVPALDRDHLLERRENELWFLLKSASSERDDLLRQAGRNGNAPVPAEAAALRRRIMQISADLEFIRELRRELDGGARNGGTPPEDDQ